MEQCPHSKETEFEILRQSFAGPTLRALADGQDTAAGHEKSAGMRKTRAVLESQHPLGESRFLSKISVTRLPHGVLERFLGREPNLRQDLSTGR